MSGVCARDGLNDPLFPLKDRSVLYGGTSGVEKRVGVVGSEEGFVRVLVTSRMEGKRGRGVDMPTEMVGPG